MQRQSLGSPSSKLIVKDEVLISETQKQFPSSSSVSNLTGLLYGEECKLKPKAKTVPESYIHLIPILTLVCFLILYLSSHDPSQNDLAQFSGLNTLSNHADLEDSSISELQRIVEIKKGDILAIRNLKQVATTANHRRLHRKFALF